MIQQHLMVDILRLGIINYSVVDSTQELIKRFIVSDPNLSNIIISADHQKSGVGRMRKSWSSVPGNTAFSILFNLNFNQSIKYLELNFVLAVAIGEAIKNILSPSFDKLLKYKWPNDILMDGKKVSGILVELYGNKCIIGIGINIFPVEGFGNLNQYNSNLTQRQIFDRVILSIQKYLNLWINSGWGKIRILWLERAYKKGEEILFSNSRMKIRGIFEGIDDEGNIILLNQGNMNKYNIGEYI